MATIQCLRNSFNVSLIEFKKKILEPQIGIEFQGYGLSSLIYK